MKYIIYFIIVIYFGWAGRTPLHLAVQNGDVESASLLLGSTSLILTLTYQNKS